MIIQKITQTNMKIKEPKPMTIVWAVMIAAILVIPLTCNAQSAIGYSTVKIRADLGNPDRVEVINDTILRVHDRVEFYIVDGVVERHVVHMTRRDKRINLKTLDNEWISTPEGWHVDRRGFQMCRIEDRTLECKRNEIKDWRIYL